MKNGIEEGDRVEKYTGDYTEEGIVVSRFLTPDNKIRFVVAHKGKTGWMLHIYSEANLRLI